MLGKMGLRGRHSVGKRILGAVGAFTLTWAMLAVPFAQATEMTRESYKAAVEPICKTNAEANERILKGVRKEVKEGKLKLAGTKFSKAATALHRTLLQLRAVEKPPADTTKLEKWLKDVALEVTLFQKTAKDLKDGNKAGAQAMVIKLTHNATQANNLVLGFEFHYCRFEPSKFT
jgi:hypothetical protein